MLEPVGVHCPECDLPAEDERFVRFACSSEHVYHATCLDRLGKWDGLANCPMCHRGSKGHQNGNCRPCRFVSTRTGCTKGDDCAFCHVRHDRAERPPQKIRRLTAELAEKEAQISNRRASTIEKLCVVLLQHKGTNLKAKKWPSN